MSDAPASTECTLPERRGASAAHDLVAAGRALDPGARMRIDAGAFGFRELVAFAHIFEATMDAIRVDRLAASPEVCEVLIHGRDVLCDLVERARSGETTSLPTAETMIEELSALSGGGPDATKPAEEPAEPEEAFDLAGERTYRIRFAPGPDFQTSGHDLLRLIQALRSLGSVQVQVEGEIPPLADLDPDVCPLVWEIGLETESGPDTVDNVFDIYRRAGAAPTSGGVELF